MKNSGLHIIKLLSGITIVEFSPEQYHLLTYNKGNRPLSKKNVERLKKLVGIYGTLRCPVIKKVGEVFEIADGQHLNKALQSENKIISCILLEGEIENAMTDMNVGNPSWNLTNHLNKFTKQGNKSYEILNDVLQSEKELKNSSNKVQGIQDCLLIRLYSGLTDRILASEKVREGTFEVKKRKNVDEFVKLVHECQISGIPSNSRRVNEKLIKFIEVFGKRYNHEGFIKEIKREANGGKIKFSDNEQDMEDLLWEIYDRTDKKMKLVA